MIGFTPNDVSAQIAAVRALSQLNEHIRTHLLDEADLSADAQRASASSYIEARKHVAESVQWRIFGHCASVTRLYAHYEAFVYELVTVWLRLLPTVYGSYEKLPTTVTANHRAGVGVLLQKLGGGSRTDHLTEIGLVRSLFEGLNGEKSFELIDEAFFIDLRNLRYSELGGLFGRVGLDEVKGWLGAHDELAALCEAAGVTVENRLDELISYRNDASHARGGITDILGVSTFNELAEFVRTLCVALHEFVVVRYFDALQEAGRVEHVGTATEYFRQSDAAILETACPVKLNVGDEVFARGVKTCFSAAIVSLQVNGVDAQSIDASGADMEMGLRATPTITRGLRVYRMRAEPAGDDETEPEKPAAQQAAQEPEPEEPDLPSIPAVALAAPAKMSLFAKLALRLGMWKR